MTYDYVQVFNQRLILSLKLRSIKCDDGYMIIGLVDSVKRYLEAVNG